MKLHNIFSQQNSFIGFHFRRFNFHIVFNIIHLLCRCNLKFKFYCMVQKWKKYPMFLWIQLIQIWYSPVYKPIGFSNVLDNVIDGAIRKRQVWYDQVDLRLLLRQMIKADDRSSELSSASVCECILLAVFCCDIYMPGVLFVGC